MTVRNERLEAMSRLLDGDLPPEESTRLRAEIASNPEAAADWAAMCGLPVELAALELDGGSVAAPPLRLRPTAANNIRPWAVVLALAAAILLVFMVRSRPTDIKMISSGIELSGQVHMALAEGTLDLDGRARLEPVGAAARDSKAEAQEMHPAATHTLSALAGAALTVTVLEGRATYHPNGGAEPTVLHAGDQISVGAPVTPRPPPPAPKVETPATVPALQARVSELEHQLAEAQFTRSLASGALVAMQGEPVPWPADAPAAARPEGFRANIDAFLADHPDMGMIAIDCDEFPCLAVLSGKVGETEPREIATALHDGLLDPSFGADPDILSMISQASTEAGAQTLYGVGIVPQGKTDDNVNTRMKFRMDALMQEGEGAPEGEGAR